MITKSTIVLSAALVVGLVSGAAARSDGDSSFESANSPVQMQTVAPEAAFAQSRAIVARRNGGNVVQQLVDTQGANLGTDPDAFIRNELLRDPPGRGD
jgi:hypothetical protein